MDKDDSNTSLQELKDLLVKFRNDRGWQQYHTPKNLAMSIAIEAAELMEHFQWEHLSGAEHNPDHAQEIADELADVILFCVGFADVTGIDISTAVRQKIAKAAEKYPTEKFNPDSLSRAEYHKIKKAYRKGKS